MDDTEKCFAKGMVGYGGITRRGSIYVHIHGVGATRRERLFVGEIGVTVKKASDKFTAFDRDDGVIIDRAKTKKDDEGVGDRIMRKMSKCRCVDTSDTRVWQIPATVNEAERVDFVGQIVLPT